MDNTSFDTICYAGRAATAVKREALSKVTTFIFYTISVIFIRRKQRDKI